jgi:hypothetical protein
VERHRNGRAIRLAVVGWLVDLILGLVVCLARRVHMYHCRQSPIQYSLRGHSHASAPRTTIRTTLSYLSPCMALRPLMITKDRLTTLYCTMRTDLCGRD